jgi:hypothetical protein
MSYPLSGVPFAYDRSSFDATIHSESQLSNKGRENRAAEGADRGPQSRSIPTKQPIRSMAVRSA